MKANTLVSSYQQQCAMVERVRARRGRVYSEDDSDDVNRNGKVLGYGCGKTGSMVGAYALIVARRAPPRLRLSPIPRCPNEAPDPRRVLPFMPRELPLAPDYWHAIFFLILPCIPASMSCICNSSPHPIETPLTSSRLCAHKVNRIRELSTTA
jgi:hypothetical protein